MKSIRLYFLLFALCCIDSLSAQKELGNRFLFPQFEKGYVFYNNGEYSTASINYDMLQQRMLFQEADTVYTIDKPRNIHVVVIDKRRFVLISPKGVFYEEIPAGNGSFFINRKARMISKGKEAAYGGYSQTESVNTFTSITDQWNTSVILKQNEKFKLETEYFYYLKSGDSYKKFYSAKTLGKLFKNYESEILQFAKEQSIDFSKIDDVARIVEYGYSLGSNP